MSVDGIYSAYLAGAAGQGMAMFVFSKGVVAGADLAGLIFKGHYAETNGRIIGEVFYKMPANSISITGAEFQTESEEIKIPFDLPAEIDPSETYTMHSPIGAMNAKFNKLSSV